VPAVPSANGAGPGPGHRPPPAVGPRPGGGTSPTKPPPANGNPFGDDRRG
jgi:hypothetical protein